MPPDNTAIEVKSGPGPFKPDLQSREIGLTQVDPVGPRENRNVGPVVDRKETPRIRGPFPDFRGEVEEVPVVESLVPELKPGETAVQKIPEVALEEGEAREILGAGEKKKARE